ncbi:PAS domain S-box-containing protein [Catalinimonas alkaloidigena]|uniref:histidine kinase n=1 Tax=Catalinimonas alkaloidigena TaxID=1075417 RepID=A0A1G9RI04_9BACT|nr:PAS domain S-box protein [Catalinimonas alkaloidigena]SDM22969.1 PAS domain S-box-containing protein [Catalinimonas alkaloidigena]
MTHRAAHLSQVELQERLEQLERANATLRQEAALSQHLFDSTVIGLALLDEEGRIARANRTFQALTGCGEGVFSPGDTTWTSLLPQLYHSHDRAMVEALAQQGAAPAYEVELCATSSTPARWVQVESSLLPEGPYARLVYLYDITERKRREQHVEALKQRLAPLFSTELVGIIRWDATGAILEANGAFLTITGYSQDDLRHGLNLLDITPPAHQDLCRQKMAEVWQKGQITPFEKEYIRKDGNRVSVLIGASSLDTQTQEALAFVLDITDRLRKEQAARENETKFRVLFDSDMLCSFFWEKSGRVVEANNAFLRTLGFDQEDLQRGRISWSAMTPPEYEALDQNALRQLDATGVCQPFEKEYIRKDGSRVPVLIGAAMLPDQSEKGLAFMLDISDRVRQERQARENDSKFRALYESDIIGIVFWNMEGTIVDANSAFLSMLGYTHEELVGHYNRRQITPPSYHPADEKAAQLIRTQGFFSPYEKQHYRKDGSCVHVLVGGTRLSGYQDRWVSYLININSQRTAQEELRLSEERFNLVAKATNDVIWDWNLSNDLVWWNDGIQTRFGYRPDDLEPDSSSWLNRIHPDDRSLIATSIHQIIDSRESTWYDEYRFRRADGSYAYVYDRGYVLRSPDGEAIRMVSAMLDVTELKLAQDELSTRAAELERVNRELRLSEEAKEEVLLSIQADNLRKTKELEEARNIQKAMLPQQPPQLDDLEIGFFMKTSAEVGGDYYDYRQYGDHTLFAIGDATGHGMRAGIVVATVKSYFQTLAGRLDPVLLLQSVSSGIRNLRIRGMYMGLSLMEWSKGKLMVASSGMPPILVYRAETQSVEVITLRGLFLGSDLPNQYQKANLQLLPGDVVLAISDGLIELFNPDGDILGQKQVNEEFRKVGHLSADEIIAHLKVVARAWLQGRENDDDMTMIVLKAK